TVAQCAPDGVHIARALRRVKDRQVHALIVQALATGDDRVNERRVRIAGRALDAYLYRGVVFRTSQRRLRQTGATLVEYDDVTVSDELRQYGIRKPRLAGATCQKKDRIWQR